MDRLTDERLLARAADLADVWTPFPNPRVGCVIVDATGAVVGEGAHHAAGEAHAEVNALRMAGPRAQGGTAYVTLEPHNHVGRTPPCSVALIEAGIARVVIAVLEPNPVAAGGADRLRAAGVMVDVIDSPAAARVNEHWLHAMRLGRPFVTLKLATSLDGRVAEAPGVETAISNAASRRRVHALRARVDAVLIGSATAVIDDPALTVRDVPTTRQPARFVMGLRDLPAHLQLLQGPVRATSLRTRDPRVALQQLQAREIRHVLVEGGPTVARAFVEAGLVDELLWITAPTVLGDGPLAMGAGLLEPVRHWRRDETLDVDGDLWSRLRP